MAEGGKSAKAVFKEAIPDLTRILGREPPFIIVTAKLNAKDLITDSELSAVRKQGLTNDQRGNEVAEKLKNKIGDSPDPNGCLLKICDVFESDIVDYPTLKDYGAEMRKSISSTTAASKVPAASPANGHTTTQTNPNELNVGDVDKVLKALNKAMFGPANWRRLGLSLGLIAPTLDVIGRANGDANDYLEKTIQKWLAKEDQVKGTTWQILKEAVENTGDKAAAGRIPLR